MDKSFCDLGFAHPNCSWLNIIRFSVQKLQKLNIELLFQLLVAFSGLLLLPSFPIPLPYQSPKIGFGAPNLDLRFKYTCHCVDRIPLACPYMPKKAVSVHGDPNIIATIRQASVRIGGSDLARCARGCQTLQGGRRIHHNPNPNNNAMTPLQTRLPGHGANGHTRTRLVKPE